MEKIGQLTLGIWEKPSNGRSFDLEEEGESRGKMKVLVWKKEVKR